MKTACILAVAAVLVASTGVGCGDVEGDCKDACDESQAECGGKSCSDRCHDATEAGCGEEYTAALTCVLDGSCDESACQDEELAQAPSAVTPPPPHATIPTIASAATTPIAFLMADGSPR